MNKQERRYILPVNCGATVPRVSLENLREDKITGRYCSRTGSTELLIRSDAACNGFKKEKKRISVVKICLYIAPGIIKGRKARYLKQKLHGENKIPH